MIEISTGAQICLFCILIIGFSISSLVIYAKGTAFPDGGDCALPMEVANLTHASLEKSLISQWRWTYEDEGAALKMRAMCPSARQEADVFYNQKLIGRTKGKLWNFEGSFDVLDCNGDKMGKWSAGSWAQNVENSFTYQVNSYIENKEGERIAYIKGENFVSSNIEIVDAIDGELVALMQRDVISLEWTWEILRKQPEHPAADWRLLLGIIGKESFATDNDKNCICNQYFYGLLYSLIAVVCIVFCMALCACCVGGSTALDACLSMCPCERDDEENSTAKGYGNSGYSGTASV